MGTQLIDGYTPVSDTEAQTFFQHAETGAQVDLEGEGVKYSVIQPGDLQRLCATIIDLRAQLRVAMKAASA